MVTKGVSLTTLMLPREKFYSQHCRAKREHCTCLMGTYERAHNYYINNFPKEVHLTPSFFNLQEATN